MSTPYIERFGENESDARDLAARQRRANARIGAQFLELADGSGLEFKDRPVDTALLGGLLVAAFVKANGDGR